MLSKILKIKDVRVLSKKETRSVLGGVCKPCIRIPGSGPMSADQIAACKACQKKNELS
ncbi:hypothetical protein [Kordia jejudonensis]|uniref:hypothetical protein n=1 Tax=Kordia jejudonensis TaxID=1348245 RepID=UPI0012E0AFF1|nr:hypothetical protein [Kordia jejudonensis]